MINAQEKNKKQVWAKKPAFSNILTDNENENVVGIFLDEKYEYFYTEEGYLQCIHTVHKKFRLNTDESINQFNKISISLVDVIDLIEIKARAIKPNGKVVEFDENNIKEIKDEDRGDSYKIFAIDGIEKGDDIEYYFVRKMNGSNFNRSFFQFKYPLQKASFKLIVPKNLFYAVKGYNNFPDATHTVLDDERNQFSCELENIPLLKDEKFAYLTSRRARVEYRLDYNQNISKSQRLTWDDAAQRLYQTMYLDLNQKQLNKWIETIHLSEGTNLEKAKQIEDYLKNNVYIQEYHTPEFSNLEYLFENKVSSAKGITKLYTNLLKHFGINNQIVITSERNSVKFDRDFQSWNYLRKYLIYLPDEDIYIDPADITFRMPCVNGDLTATDGLFIKLVQVGDFESAIGQIKYIKPAPHDANYYNMNIDIDINADNIETRVVTMRGFKGLSGGYIANYYKMMDAEQKEEMLKSFMDAKISNLTYNSLEVVEECNIDFLSDAEFIIFSDLSSSSFIENAGNRLLLNIGETIGTQVEMYFEEDRKTSVENEFNRSYYREITVNVPEGYKILNPDAADINFVEKVNNENIFGFESSHTYEGNKYKIIIKEYYKEIFADHKQFIGFKDVVNAAADFNKVVLVLEKL